MYKCWQVQVRYDFVDGSEPYTPPWNSVSRLQLERDPQGDGGEAGRVAKLYPNVKGCGYPPELGRCCLVLSSFSLAEPLSQPHQYNP